MRRIRVVANKTESSSQGLDVYAVLAQLADRHLDMLLDYCRSVSFDRFLKQAVCEQRPVVEAFPRLLSALALRKLSTQVACWPKPQTPCGHIEFFVERLVRVADNHGTR